MIYWLQTAFAKDYIASYLASTGKQIAPEIYSRIRLLHYEELHRMPHLLPGTYLFSDLERMSPEMTSRAASTWAAAKQAGFPALNHPIHGMRRYELLRTLYDEGVNDFDVLRVTEHRRPRTYPVFIRSEIHHDGSLTSRLNNPRELDAALDYLLSKGYSKEELIIIGLKDTSTPDGIFRKYSAFVIGDQVIADHIQFSNEWMVKGKTVLPLTAEMLEEEYRYVQENPHQKAIRDIFNLAKIQYGRMDYGYINGRIQVWEINTHPTHYPLSTVDSRRLALKIKGAEAVHHAMKSIDMVPASLKRVRNPVHQPAFECFAKWLFETIPARHRYPIARRLSNFPLLKRWSTSIRKPETSTSLYKFSSDIINNYHQEV